tara:strand:+ start:1109 stop:1288 length:180 start_codon:yes stop_codon:yes gene_type:complete
MAHETWHTKAWIAEKIKKGKKEHGDHYPATDAQIDEVYGPGSVEKEFDRIYNKKNKKNK